MESLAVLELGANQWQVRAANVPALGESLARSRALRRDCLENPLRLLTEINAHLKWVALANSSDERIALETLKYLTDRAYGKARQSIEASAAAGTEVQVQYVARSILDKS